MLQPYYVYVDPAILADARAGNPFNVAFGLEEDPLPALRVTNQLLEDELMLWPEALPVAAFDEWTFNRDRIPGNLLFAGNRHFWLIDHDEALPNYASPEANSSSPLLQILSRDKSQFELFNMRKSLRARIDEYRSVDWAEVLRFLVPEQLTGSVPIFNRYIWFLKKRIEYLDEIFSQNLGIRQQELDLDSAGDRFRKKET